MDDPGEILLRECETEGVSLHSLRVMRRGPSPLVPVRRRIVRRLLYETTIPIPEIADLLHCHPETVRMILRSNNSAVDKAASGG